MALRAADNSVSLFGADYMLWMVPGDPGEFVALSSISLALTGMKSTMLLSYVKGSG